MELLTLINKICFFVIIIAAIVIAFQKNKKFRKNHPTLRSYAYGYYMGYFCYAYVIQSILPTVFSFVGLTQVLFDALKHSEETYLFVIMLVNTASNLVVGWIYWIFGKAYMNHRRWQWVVSMVFISFSVGAEIYLGYFSYQNKPLSSEGWIALGIGLGIVFILHLIYFKKRWQELDLIYFKKRLQKLDENNTSFPEEIK